MALMTVNDEGRADSRSNNRWSANKKLDVVLRLLRGEKLEELSREVGVEAHRLAAWPDEFLDAGKEDLKGKRATTEEDRRLRDAERKIGELTLENEVWKKVAEKGGSRCRRRSGRGECGDGDSPGQSVRHHRCTEIHHLSPAIPG
jgi:transposase